MYVKKIDGGVIQDEVLHAKVVPVKSTNKKMISAFSAEVVLQVEDRRITNRQRSGLCGISIHHGNISVHTDTRALGFLENSVDQLVIHHETYYAR